VPRRLRFPGVGVVGLVVVLVVASSPAKAQNAPRRGRLSVTVMDQTTAILPNAVVVVEGQDQALTSVRREGRTSGFGVAVFDELEPGRYTIRTEFAGFQPAVVRDVRVRAGDNRRTVTLQLQKLDEDVTVSRDKQSAAMDPRGSAFSTVLTREQIEALPDDPDEMERVLKAMAPPGATIRIDGFTGGKLPPKSQIRSIRLPRMDSFAAQNHGGMSGALHIDIMTMPGAGPLRGGADFNFADDALNAKNALSKTKGEEQLRQGNFSLSGTIKPNKTSFSVNAGLSSQYFSSNIYAVLPNGVVVAEPLRQPQDRRSLFARVDHIIRKDHAIRLSYDRSDLEQRNLGVGDYNLPSRRYMNTSATNMLRFSENGPVGRRLFTESRLQVRWSDTASTSDVEEMTIRVNDAFTSGGAQMRGGRQDVTFELASDLDYVRGNHSWRTGLLLEGGQYTSDDTSNYLGTYTFASLADYEAGRASSYLRRIGDPYVRYSQIQGGVYLQDDWRARRSLLVSAGVRYGFQNHVGDAWNLSPRVSAAWSPYKDGKLTLRASYGYFYDWVAGDLYKQTLLVDGYRQRELNIINPSYPDPGLIGTSPPTNRYLWSDDLLLPNAHRLGAGIDRGLTPNSRVNVSYNFGFGANLLRPRNLNIPVGGVRPDPEFANELKLVSDASSKQHSVNIGWNLMKMEWKRLFLYANYTISTARTNTTGAFSLPANGDDLDAEWGPTSGDARHRVSGSINIQPITNLSVSLNASYRSATPYNITTGRDDNEDGVFNDRPAGVTRNSERGADYFELSGRLSYGFAFGPKRPAGGAGGGGGQTMVVAVGSGGGGGGGAMAAGFAGGASDRRFRLDFYVSGQNLLNRTNYTSFSGVLTSPLFGQPTAAGTPRRIQLGVRFGF
jgi:hypothetical protein